MAAIPPVGSTSTAASASATSGTASAAAPAASTAPTATGSAASPSPGLDLPSPKPEGAAEDDTEEEKKAAAPAPKKAEAKKDEDEKENNNWAKILEETIGKIGKAVADFPGGLSQFIDNAKAAHEADPKGGIMKYLGNTLMLSDISKAKELTDQNLGEEKEKAEKKAQKKAYQQTKDEAKEGVKSAASMAIKSQPELAPLAAFIKTPAGEKMLDKAAGQFTDKMPPKMQKGMAQHAGALKGMDAAMPSVAGGPATAGAGATAGSTATATPSSPAAAASGPVASASSGAPTPTGTTPKPSSSDQKEQKAAAKEDINSVLARISGNLINMTSQAATAPVGGSDPAASPGQPAGAPPSAANAGKMFGLDRMLNGMVSNMTPRPGASKNQALFNPGSSASNPLSTTAAPGASASGGGAPHKFGMPGAGR